MNKPRRTYVADYPEWKRLFEEDGLSLRHISRLFGCDHKTVRIALGKMGVDTTKTIRDPQERFWEKVNTRGDCWVWQAGTYGGPGYGQFFDGEKYTGAHRFSYELHHGPIPDGLHVCHTCDNPPCVNPTHLFVGTRDDNMLDMAQKERSGMAKLNVVKVRQLRRRFAEGGVTKQQLADENGVTRTAIYSAITRKCWRHV